MSTPDAPRIVSATREIASPAALIFDLIADPLRQPEWDGNDNLEASASGQRVHAVGDVFVTSLTRGGVRQNRIVAFEEGRLIAWRPSEQGLPEPGHEWRWQLEPTASGTRVTHTYDWSQLTDEKRLERARWTTPERLAASLDRLAALAEG